jgi:hypothetical protein
MIGQKRNHSFDLLHWQKVTPFFMEDRTATPHNFASEHLRNCKQRQSANTF